jgi:hypothetical protein
MLDVSRVRAGASAAGLEVNQCSEHHFQIMDKFGPLVDFWPTSDKFRATQAPRNQPAKMGVIADVIRLAKSLSHATKSAETSYVEGDRAPATSDAVTFLNDDAPFAAVDVEEYDAVGSRTVTGKRFTGKMTRNGEYSHDIFIKASFKNQAEARTVLDAMLKIVCSADTEGKTEPPNGFRVLSPRELERAQQPPSDYGVAATDRKRLLHLLSLASRQLKFSGGDIGRAIATAIDKEFD